MGDLAANVAELADAPDLGSGGRKAMGVRPSPFAPVLQGSGSCPAGSRLRQILLWSKFGDCRGKCPAISPGIGRGVLLDEVDGVSQRPLQQRSAAGKESKILPG